MMDEDSPVLQYILKEEVDDGQESDCSSSYEEFGDSGIFWPRDSLLQEEEQESAIEEELSMLFRRRRRSLGPLFLPVLATSSEEEYLTSMPPQGDVEFGVDHTLALHEENIKLADYGDDDDEDEGFEVEEDSPLAALMRLDRMEDLLAESDGESDYIEIYSNNVSTTRMATNEPFVIVEGHGMERGLIGYVRGFEPPTVNENGLLLRPPILNTRRTSRESVEV